MVVKTSLVFVVAVVLLTYYCHEPVPPDVPQPTMFAAMATVMRTARHMANIGDYLGIGTEPTNLRYILWALTRAGQKVMTLGTAYREGLECTDTVFDGVSVRVYEPVSAAQSNVKVPGLVFIHGGGFVLLNVDMFDELTAHLAKELGIVVVSVEYRLAPEHMFPAAFDDSVAATKFFLQNAGKYNVDRTRIGISGDSAGGNLAAAVTLALAKEKGLPKLKTQALMYPVLQAIDFNTPSYIDNGYMNILSKDLMVSFWLWYLNNDVSSKELLKANNHTSVQLKKSQYAAYVDHKMVRPNLRPKVVTPVKKENIEFPEIPNIATILDPRFAPLMADDADLEGLPPTFIMTCEYDVLRDDGVMYATRLQKSGVRVEHDHYERGFHGFLPQFRVNELAGNAMDNLLAYLRKNL